MRPLRATSSYECTYKGKKKSLSETMNVISYPVASIVMTAVSKDRFSFRA